MTAILERAAARGELESARPPGLLARILPSLLFTRLLVLDAPVDDRYLTRVVDDVLLPLVGAARPPRREVSASRHR
ncbi:MAG TPA: TetR-like C-terminal domain-containing protein [Vicinamibacterales bacterium]